MSQCEVYGIGCGDDGDGDSGAMGGERPYYAPLLSGLAGGGVPPKRQTVSKTGSMTTSLRAQLNTAIGDLGSGCKKFFNSLSGGLSALSGCVNSLQFFNGTNPAGDGALNASAVLAGAANETLYAMGQGVGALVISNSSGPSNGILIGSLWNGLGDVQGVTLVHEASHYAYNMNDSDFANAVYAYDPTFTPPAVAQGNASMTYTAFLEADCPSK
jgi:hypothetical protein